MIHIKPLNNFPALQTFPNFFMLSADEPQFKKKKKKGGGRVLKESWWELFLGSFTQILELVCLWCHDNLPLSHFTDGGQNKWPLLHFPMEFRVPCVSVSGRT